MATTITKAHLIQPKIAGRRFKSDFEPVYCPTDGKAYRAFPPDSLAMSEPNGLLAVGGDYSSQRLNLAFSRGIFPWTNADNPILWWTPNPRCVFKLNEWRSPRSLRRLFNKTFAHGVQSKHWQLDFNRDIPAVLKGCADRHETWLCDSLIKGLLDFSAQYSTLMSVEIRYQGQLVGGIYGVKLYPVIIAESMFSRIPSASKLALMALIEYAQLYQFSLVDAQMPSDHLLMLGATTISRLEFQENTQHTQSSNRRLT